jgi:hypothetical protein
MKLNRVYTRRAWLGAAASVTAGAAALGWLLPFMRRKAIDLMYSAAPIGTTPPPPEDLRVVAHFTSALMGRRLDDTQIGLLVRRLAMAGRRRGPEYAALVVLVNREARRLDSKLTSFAEASDEVRESIVQRTMREPSQSRVARVALLVSTDNRSRLRIRHGTARHLRFVYARSSIPWTIRGYTGVPGAPQDRLEYTRPGPTKFG